MSEFLLALLGIFVSLFPERYRKRFFPNASVDTQRGALLSGIVEMFGCLALFIVRYLFFIQWRPQTVAELAKKKGVEEVLGNTMVQFGIGMTTMLEYLIQPLTLLIIFFIFEGLVRGLAAFISGEVVPSLPLQAVAWLHGLSERRAKEISLGPLVEDVVKPVDTPAGGLCIESCRPNEWNRLTTISYDDRLFEVETSAEQGLPRRFLYVLRPAPANKIVRGLHHYRVDEVFDKAPVFAREETQI